MSQFKTVSDLASLSGSQLTDLYLSLHEESKDEWFPIMYVSEVCPHCSGEAHLFDNFKQLFLQIVCFNQSCSFNGKVVDDFLKGDDFFALAIAIKLGIS